MSYVVSCTVVVWYAHHWTPATMGDAAMRATREVVMGEIEATKARRVEGEYPRQ